MIVATRAASNLASSFENTPPGGRICTGMRGLSKQHDKKHDINRNDYFIIRIRQ
jgi:hypothetical protein